MWHLDDAVEISRGRYCRLQKSTPKDARWGRTLHLSMLTSERYSSHSTNVIFSPKLRVTQMLSFLIHYYEFGVRNVSFYTQIISFY